MRTRLAPQQSARAHTSPRHGPAYGVWNLSCQEMSGLMRFIQVTSMRCWGRSPSAPEPYETGGRVGFGGGSGFSRRKPGCPQARQRVEVGRRERIVGAEHDL